MNLGVQLIQAIIQELPAVAAMIMVVWFFLKHLKETTDTHVKTMDKIADRNFQIQTETKTAINKNTEILTELKGKVSARHG